MIVSPWNPRSCSVALSFVLVTALAFGANDVSAQPPACDWESGLHYVGVNQLIWASTVFDDGNGPGLYVGGAMNGAGETAARFIARWDGSSFSPLGEGMNSFVKSLAVYDDGGGSALYAGGWFTTAGGVSANHIAKWDGSSWSSLGSGINTTGVEAMASYDDGGGAKLFVGGSFSNAGGTVVSNIASWDGTSWSAVGGTTNGQVLALAVHDDGGGPALYAGGTFTLIGGVAANSIAKWDGTSWTALSTGTNAAVTALTVHDDGGGSALFAGGTFTTAGGVGANRVAKWDGSAWTALGSGTDGRIDALASYNDGSGAKLYAGGEFLNAGGGSALSLAAWDGTSWASLQSGTDGEVFSMVTYDEGSGARLFIGGDYLTAGGGIVSRITRWDGTSFSPLGSAGKGVSSIVWTQTVYDDGGGSDLYVGGLFDTAGSVTVHRIARWDGDAWSALGTGMNEDVLALAVFDDGGGSDLYVGGEFTTAGGTSANYIARWDGSSWSTLGTGMNAPINALVVYDDGGGPALYAGGNFTTAGGAPANYIAKWDGTSWTALSSGTDNRVYSLHSHSDGALYAGGDFTAAGGVGVGRIARWSAGSWSAVGTGMNNRITTLTSHDDGGGSALYAGGSFTTADGLSANRVARWNGISWSALGAGMDNWVFDLASLEAGAPAGSGSVLYAGGLFLNADGSPAKYIATWDGTSWSSFGDGADWTVYSFAAFGDDGIGTPLYMGGNFAEVDGVGSARWAKRSCVQVDLELSWEESVDPVVASSTVGNLVHTATLTNHGPSTASNLSVDVSSVLPAGAVLSGASTSAGLYAAGTWNLDALASGASATLALTYSVSASAPAGAVVETSATATASEPDANLADNAASVGTTVATSASLSLAYQSAAPNPVAAGENLLYTLNVLADGPSDAQDVVITNSLPAGVTLSATTGCAEDPAGVPTCTLGTLEVGLSVQVSIEVTVDSSTNGLITSTSTLSSSTPDPNLGDNTSSIDVLTDGIAPTILKVESDENTADEQLSECEYTDVSIETLILAFSEDMDPSVGNAANYLLLGAGLDGEFSTDSCAGGVQGDDIPVTIRASGYAAAFQAVFLEAGLKDDLYRLLVCADGVADTVGLALDGDGDGTGGDDFRLHWRIERRNAFVNGDLDCTLGDWITASELPEEIAYANEDVQGSSLSGSARVRKLGSGNNFSLAQCFEPLPYGPLDPWPHGAQIRLDMASGTLDAVLFCEHFDASACAGNSLGITQTSTAVSDTAGAWQALRNEFTPIPGTLSSLCGVRLTTPSGAGFDAYLDSLFGLDVPLFDDGFESGDASLWSRVF